jgi:hypothetical protein
MDAAILIILQARGEGRDGIYPPIWDNVRRAAHQHFDEHIPEMIDIATLRQFWEESLAIARRRIDQRLAVPLVPVVEPPLPLPGVQQLPEEYARVHGRIRQRIPGIHDLVIGGGGNQVAQVGQAAQEYRGNMNLLMAVFQPFIRFMNERGIPIIITLSIIAMILFQNGPGRRQRGGAIPDKRRTRKKRRNNSRK